MFEKCKDLFYTIFLTMILAVCGQTEIFGYISSDVSHVDFLLVYVYTLCGLFYNFSQWVFSKCCFCSCFGDLSYSYHYIAFNFPIFSATGILMYHLSLGYTFTTNYHLLLCFAEVYFWIFSSLLILNIGRSWFCIWNKNSYIDILVF